MKYELSEVTKPYITWAVIDNKIEWVEGKTEHKDWLRDAFGVTQRSFEDIICGYIQNNRNGKVDVVYFKGSGFDECQIDNKLLAKVLLITDLCYLFDNINLYSGLKARKNSEIYTPIGPYKVLTKLDSSSRLVSIKQIIDYEDKLVSIINNTVYSSNEIFRKELSICYEALNNYIGSKGKLLDREFKRRVVTYVNLL